MGVRRGGVGGMRVVIVWGRARYALVACRVGGMRVVAAWGGREELAF